MAEPSGCPFVPAFRQNFPGRNVCQAPEMVPERTATGFSLLQAEAICILRSPVTRPLKERFRLSATTETPGTFGPFAQIPALLICGPEGPTEPDCVSIK
jgi:hypothetical protein